MKKILGNAKTIRELLGGAKHSIDYYQREYRWQTKQMAELINDLTSKLLKSYLRRNHPAVSASTTRFKSPRI